MLGAAAKERGVAIQPAFGWTEDYRCPNCPRDLASSFSIVARSRSVTSSRRSGWYNFLRVSPRSNTACRVGLMSKSPASRQRRSTLKSLSCCSPDELPSLANRFSVTVSRLRGKQVGSSQPNSLGLTPSREILSGPKRTNLVGRGGRERPCAGASQGRARKVYCVEVTAWKQECHSDQECSRATPDRSRILEKRVNGIGERSGLRCQREGPPTFFGVHSQPLPLSHGARGFLMSPEPHSNKRPGRKLRGPVGAQLRVRHAPKRVSLRSSFEQLTSPCIDDGQRTVRSVWSVFAREAQRAPRPGSSGAYFGLLSG